jgi:hypothetical protein
MYIGREALEEALVNAVNGSRNILIHGHSGCGQSWLYKHTLKELGTETGTRLMAHKTVRVPVSLRGGRWLCSRHSHGQRSVSGPTPDGATGGLV